MYAEIFGGREVRVPVSSVTGRPSGGTSRAGGTITHCPRSHDETNRNAGIMTH